MKKHLLFFALLLLCCLLTLCGCSPATVVGSHYDAEGNLILEMSDGSTVNAGHYIPDEEPLSFSLQPDGTYAVSAGRATRLTELVIPATHNGADVTAVCAEGFAECKATRIVLPDTIRTLGAGAFRNCSALTALNLPEGITEIPRALLYGCAALKEITLPAGITVIGDAAFHGTAIESLSLPATVQSIGKSAFAVTPLKSMVLPEGITEIPNAAFESCAALEQITLPSSVTAIGDSAFCGCRSLKSVELPAAVTRIGAHAFSGCAALTAFAFPTGVTVIDSSVLGNCAYLEQVTLPPNATEINDSAFAHCSALAEIALPATLRVIGQSAFADCDSLRAVTVPEGVVEIRTGAFADCDKLRRIILPSSLQILDTYAFNGDNSLQFNALGAGLYLGNEAEPHMVLVKLADRTVTDLVIPEGTRFIQNDVLKGSAVERLTIPGSVHTVPSNAFSGQAALKQVSLGAGVRYIGYDAFRKCNALEAVFLAEPDGWYSKDPYYSYPAATPLSEEELSDPAKAAALLKQAQGDLTKDPKPPLWEDPPLIDREEIGAP